LPFVLDMRDEHYDCPILSASNGIIHERLLKRGSQYLLYRFTAEDGRPMVVKYDYRAVLSIAQENLKAGREPLQFSDEALRAAARVANVHNEQLDKLRRSFRKGVPAGFAESVILEVSGEWVRGLTTSGEFQALFKPRLTYSVTAIAQRFGSNSLYGGQVISKTQYFLRGEPALEGMRNNNK
jgi:hypothetical protein